MPQSRAYTAYKTAALPLSYETMVRHPRVELGRPKAVGFKSTMSAIPSAARKLRLCYHHTRNRPVYTACSCPLPRIRTSSCLFTRWCVRRESNSHDRSRQFLRLVCLPIPPLTHRNLVPAVRIERTRHPFRRWMQPLHQDGTEIFEIRRASPLRVQPFACLHSFYFS